MSLFEINQLRSLDGIIPYNEYMENNSKTVLYLSALNPSNPQIIFFGIFPTSWVMMKLSFFSCIFSKFALFRYPSSFQIFKKFLTETRNKFYIESVTVMRMVSKYDRKARTKNLVP